MQGHRHHALPLLLASICFVGSASAAPEADTPGSVVPERAYDILALHLDIELDPEARTVRGTARYTAKPLHDAPLFLNRVDVDIQEVRGVDTAAPPHHVRPGLLVIDATEAHLGEDGTLDFEVDFEARPWTGAHFRDTPVDAYAEVWTQGQSNDHRHWFPGWDHPNDRFDYTGTVKAPDGWRATTNSGHDLPNYLIMFAAGPYEEVIHTTDPTTKVWVPPGTDAIAVATVLDPVPAMKAHFAERTGAEYPWGDYLQVFAQRFIYGGMENTGATINGARALVDARVTRTRPNVPSLVAHELAHQWFGDLLTCRTWRDLWLNEGFATFMAGDYLAEAEATPETRDAHWAQQVLRWSDRSASQSQPMARRWHHEDGRDSHNVYSRGAATLWMLRAHLGEAAFWMGVQDYVARHAHGPVETVDLRRAMEGVSGRDLNGFFQQWTERTGSPDFTVRDSQQDGQLVITVNQKASEKKPLFHVPVEVMVGTTEGTVTEQGWMEEDTIQFRVPVDGEVEWVAIDPRGAVVGEWTHKQSTVRLERQALDAPGVARLRAIRALGETDASTALATLLSDSTQPLPYRTAAAYALGEQRALQPLLSAASDADDAVRLAVASALGDCPDPAAVASLNTLLRTDANPDVQAAALSALARIAPQQAVQRARPLLRLTDQEEGRLMSAAARVLGRYGETRDFKALLQSGVPLQNRTTALYAALQWVQRQQDPAIRKATGSDVARATEPLLSDLNIRTRQSALRILQEVGDRQSISPLEAHRRATRVESEREAAQDAIDAIRKRRRPDYEAPESSTAAEVERLQGRLDALEERLDLWDDKY